MRYFILSDKALTATMTVLNDIKMAPMAGLKTMPTGARIPAANGMAMMLYPAAHHRFCTILEEVLLANDKK